MTDKIRDFIFEEWNKEVIRTSGKAIQGEWKINRFCGEYGTKNSPEEMIDAIRRLRERPNYEPSID